MESPHSPAKGGFGPTDGADGGPADRRAWLTPQAPCPQWRDSLLGATLLDGFALPSVTRSVRPTGQAGEATLR